MHLPLTQLAGLLEQYYPRETQTAPIEHILRQIPFSFNFSDLRVEEDMMWMWAYERAIKLHLAANPHVSAGTYNEWARLIEKRLPPSSQLTTYYFEQKNSDLLDQRTDNDTPAQENVLRIL
jgi:hypothetical protein